MSTSGLNFELMIVGKILKLSFGKDPMRSSASGFSNDSIVISKLNEEVSRFKHPSLLDDLCMVESMLVERLSIPETQILQFSSEAYYNARNESQKNINVSNQKVQKLLAYIQDILVNYSALAVYQGEMFPNQSPALSHLDGLKKSAARVVDFLLRAGSKDYFGLIVNYWDKEDPEFKEQIILEIVVNLNQMNKQFSLINDPAPVAGVFKSLLECNLLKDLIQKHFFNENWNAGEIEANSIFSAYLQPGLFPRAPYFGKIPGMPTPADPVREKIGKELKSIKFQKDFDRTIEHYSNSKKAYTLIITDIFKIILKQERKLAMDWLCDTVTKCAEKAKLGNRLGPGNLNNNASDSFCLNLFDILLQLCQPFLDPQNNLVAKISDVYLAANPRMSKILDTPICNTIEKAKVNFEEVGTVTEFYYCCCLMFHYSWNTAYSLVGDLNRVLQRLQNSQNPAEKQDFEHYIEIHGCFDVILRDPYRNSLILKLCNLTFSLILKWAGFNGTLPLPSPSHVLSIIPEFFIEDISEFYVAMLEFRTNTLSSCSIPEISQYLTAITVILLHPGHFTNPYTRAKFVKSFSLLLTSKSCGDLVTVMNTHNLFQQYFVEGLVRFFVDIEFGGGHSQFYDKFEYRHYASLIFEYLWKIPLYQQNTVQLQKSEFFVKFINYILNDMTYCLQEGIDNLIKIKKLKSKSPDSLDEEEKKDLSQKTGLCKYMMQQSNEYISLLKQVSEWNSQLFITDEFGERTAALLNNFLKHLCGPKFIELKVDNPAEYNFKPEALLRDLLTIYLYISRHEQFFECIIKDGRSFSLELFTKALNICQKRPILSYDEKNLLASFIGKLKTFEHDQLKVELQDIPEEFLCEITCELMKNPIKLPSGKTVDRVNIVRHLLSDENDPFSRQPLKTADLVEDIELKQRIEAWVASQRG